MFHSVNFIWHVTLAHRQGSGEVWIWVAGQEAVGRLVVNERVVGQPLDGTAPGAGIPEGVARRQQVRMVPVQLVLEPAERSLP